MADSERSSIMDRRTRRLFMFLAVVSFLAAMTTIVFGRKAREFTPIATDSFTDGPLGNKAFVQIMQALDVETRRQRSAGRGDASLTWFIEPLRPEVPTPDGKARLLDTLDERIAAEYPSVLVLPKWVLDAGGQATPVPTMHIDQLLREVPSLDATTSFVERTGLPHEVSKPYRVITPMGEYDIEVPYLQTFRLPDGFAPVIELVSGGGVLMATSNDGLVSVLSEPDLLHNFNIHKADHAAIFTGLAQWQSDESFHVDEVFHGHAHTLSLRDALARWPVVLLPIHAVILALLLLLRGVQRFGEPQDDPSPLTDPAQPANPHADEGIRVTAMALTMNQTDAGLLSRYVAAIFTRIAHRNKLRANTPLARAAEIDAMRTNAGLEPFAELLWQDVKKYGSILRPSRSTRANLIARAKRLLRDHQT